MSVQEAKLRAIADAIREKDGSTEPIPASTFPERIRAIPTGGGLPEDVFTISVKADPPEGGTVSGGGVASQGMTVTVRAEKKHGYGFSGWFENGERVSEEAEYTFPVSKSRELTAEIRKVTSHDLPEGYTELEYVEATGKQYFKWNVYARGYQIVAMEVEPPAKTGTYALWGATASKVGWYLYYYYYHNSTSGDVTQKLQSGLGVSANSCVEISSIDISEKRTYIKQDKINKVLTINDETFAIKAEDSSSLIYATLFANAYTSTSNQQSFSNFFTGKIYSMEVSTKSDGTINHHYIPCIQDSSGIAGFYNILSNTFYRSASGTDFIAGPAI